jgi:hypothetical protein
MRGRWLAIVAIASLALNVAVVGSFVFINVRRHQRPHPRIPGFGPEIPPEVRAVFEDARPRMDSLRALIDRVGEEMRAEEELNTPDETRIDSLCREAGRLHGLMMMTAHQSIRRVVQMMPEGKRHEFIENFGRRMGHGGRAMHGRRRMMPGPGEPGPDEPPAGEPPDGR